MCGPVNLTDAWNWFSLYNHNFTVTVKDTDICAGAICRHVCKRKRLLRTMSRLLQKDAEQEAQMRAEIQDMKQELSTVNMMDEFARYARLERKINKMTDKLKTHVKARTAQLAKIKWVISVAFYVLQAALMVSLIWKYYSVPVAVVPSKWITPLDRLVAFPTRVAGEDD
ncbi:guided entry of tail-anchored proteins factor 1 isoform X3 [Mirounga leonina]|uniref:guided entry of tail-anchored proteins factor 1 isoform X3 n=1 Tax=Mirounga leonina TaxID=9715 RepID=UPI00156C11EA|nr:guided entry of tail-anchored proteins factor 1 isoform X3 [Mirounga leonina]